uniref:Uncharacterized protein n=1 Tax=Papio anubis TaxID=9555 RepID=A0A8I5NRA8_PAPAN
MEFHSCCPGWSAVVQSQLTATSTSRFKRFSCLSLQVAGITRVRHHAQLIFVILVGTGFHYVGQAGLELLTSDSDLPASTSQSADNYRHEPLHPAWHKTFKAAYVCGVKFLKWVKVCRMF